MTDISIRNLVFGFIAGAIAALTMHQIMLIVLTAAGLIKAQGWVMVGIPPFGVPKTINDMFWGGLWGALFALIWARLPGAALWIKGLVYGLAMVVLSNWLLLPLIKGKVFGVANQALFAGGDPKRLLATAVLIGIFGITTALLYGLLAKPRNA